MVSVALDRVRTVSTKWGLTGLTTGIKTAPSVLAFYEVTLLMGSLKSKLAHFPGDLLPRGYRLKSGCLPFEPLLLPPTHQSLFLFHQWMLKRMFLIQLHLDTSLRKKNAELPRTVG